MLEFDHENFKGKPYQYLGRTLEGFDCLGLIFLILQENEKLDKWFAALEGKNVQDIYPEGWDAEPDARLEQFLRALGDDVTDKAFQKGDILLYDSGVGYIDVAGVYLPGGYMFFVGEKCAAVPMMALSGLTLKSVIRVA